MASASNQFKPAGKFTGAAFLMATAAIGPGFITQTTVFTFQLFTSFGFIILVSVLLDIVVQLIIWRAVTISGKKAPVLANEVFPGLGALLVILVASGGLVFNIGNIAGCSLALQSLTGLAHWQGALLSGALAMIIFVVKEFGRAMDVFTKILGVVMIGLMLYVAYTAAPPLKAMLVHTVLPQKVDVLAIVTLVGGTVGGYISFAGAHRMLDSGANGIAHLKTVDSGAVTGILLAAVMRVLLFAAVAGVVAKGLQMPGENPAAEVFRSAAGTLGLRMFGIILWAAAITSVVAAAYTSVSFISAISPVVQAFQRQVIIGFILVSALLFTWFGNPTQLLVRAGTINGLILPVALFTVLIAATRKNILKGYRFPQALVYAGWAVVIVLTVMGGRAVFLLFK